MTHWLMHFMGLDSGTGRWYLFWSGFGADISELAIVGALLALVRKHTCHVQGCWRIGRAAVDGAPWRTCWRHHPAGRPAHEYILSLHREYLEARARRNTPASGSGKAGERLYDHERDGL